MTTLYDLSNFPALGIDLTAYPEIGEVDRSLRVFDVVAVGGKQYAVSMTRKEPPAAGVRPCEIRDEPDETENEGSIVCPYCLYSDADSFERGGSGEMRCCRCGARFKFDSETTVTYTAVPLAPPKVIKAEWVRKKGRKYYRKKRSAHPDGNPK